MNENNEEKMLILLRSMNTKLSELKTQVERNKSEIEKLKDAKQNAAGIWIPTAAVLALVQLAIAYIQKLG